MKVRLSPVSKLNLWWLAELRNNVKEYLGDSDFTVSERQESWFERVVNDSTMRYFIVESPKDGGVSVGMVRITQIDMVNRSACVGGDIHPCFQGNGYGTAMMKEIKRYCFEVLNLRRLWLLVLGTNKRARKLYEKSGFKIEGVQKEAIWRGGRYVDYVMMSFIRKGSK